jgi:aarF domain-containing kinase
LLGSGGEGRTSIKVPKVYWNYTRKSILALEWIDGIKLTDAERISKANLNRKRMIDEVSLHCSLLCTNIGTIDVVLNSFLFF